MKDRIRQLMIAQHMNQQSFADVLEISPASLSSIFNDRTKPTLNHIDAIKKKFPSINLDWLMYGRGPMFLDDVSQGNDMRPSAVSSSESVLQFDVATSTPSESKPEQPRLDFSSSRDYAQMAEKTTMKYIDNNMRKITEIRIFYDDQTWETFVPKK